MSQLRNSIVSGGLQPGTRLPSDRELARQHSVAPGTVATAMTRLAHEGLVQRSRGRGSFVVEELPVQKKTLEFVRFKAPAGAAPSASTLDWIERFSHLGEQHGWTPHWHHVLEDGVDHVKQLVDRFSGSGSVIIFGDGPSELPWLLHQRSVPVVSIFPKSGGLGEVKASYPQITYDRYDNARLATEHLIAVGHHKIAFIGLKSSPLFTLGFIAALRAHNIPLRPEWIAEMEKSTSSLSELQMHLWRLLQEQNRPQAFCCVIEDMAIVLGTAAKDLGLTIPEDLAVIACDTLGQSISQLVGVTTLTIDRNELCNKALSLIEQQQNAGKAGKTPLHTPVKVPLYLTVRDSCGGKLKGVHQNKSWTEESGEDSA